MDFFDYDPYAQALAKIERGHTRDLTDVAAMLDRSLIHRDRLLALFGQIEPASSLPRHRTRRLPQRRPGSVRSPSVMLSATTATPISIADLPGADLISTGLAQARDGRETPLTCLISIALPRLHRAGLLAPGQIHPHAEPELLLYRLLRREPGDAFSRYHALLRRLVRFEHALDHRAALGRKWKC